MKTSWGIVQVVQYLQAVQIVGLERVDNQFKSNYSTLTLTSTIA